jgi:hypothetical protein
VHQPSTRMTELKPVSTPMSSATSLVPDEDGEAVDQRERVHELDPLPPVSHSDTAGYLVRRRAMCVLSGFPTLFTSDGSSTNI